MTQTSIYGENTFFVAKLLYNFSYGYLVTSVICMNFIKSMKEQNNKEKTKEENIYIYLSNEADEFKTVCL